MHENVVRQLSARTGVNFRPASEADLASIRALGFPEAAIRFYQTYEPDACVEIGSVRLWPIPDAVDENQRYVPGADVVSKGFLVFASTTYGDAYCLDVRAVEADQTPPVVLLPHDVGFEECTGAEVAQYARRVATDLDDFLQKFVRKELETEPFYPPAAQE